MNTKAWEDEGWGRRLGKLRTKAAYPDVSRLQRDHMDQLKQPGEIRLRKRVVFEQSNSEQI
jgi:hypothetical protein